MLTYTGVVGLFQRMPGVGLSEAPVRQVSHLDLLSWAVAACLSLRIFYKWVSGSVVERGPSRRQGKQSGHLFASWPCSCPGEAEHRALGPGLGLL